MDISKIKRNARLTYMENYSYQGKLYQTKLFPVQIVLDIEKLYETLACSCSTSEASEGA